MPLDETVFITGFPGFIAGRLLERLAREGGRFLLLVQSPFVDRAQIELERIARQTGNPLSHFRILEGDIAQPNLGMSQDDLAIASSQPTVIFHLAAIYDLAVTRDIAMQVNVVGTKNVNQFAQSLPNLRHYHYVSTCYVAGKRQGRILETELKHAAGFRNYYEESKYLAEVEVEALKSTLPITIHRPAVVCGDSKTGETAKYDGVYYLIHYVRKWPSVLKLFNIGNREVSLNLVPVDFVVDGIAALVRDPRAIGKTIQLADPDPLTTHELFNTIARCLKGSGSRITVPASIVQFSLMLPPSPRITDLPHHGVPYFFLKQTYDTLQASALLESHDLQCPPFSSYVHTIVDYAVAHPALQP
ncbi:MAG: SDR family oxidoreductase [Pyrinomonadaceae bacterium]|nr:SDR family oxidoreductase [Pyrinomonadaceae bacterium]